MKGQPPPPLAAEYAAKSKRGRHSNPAGCCHPGDDGAAALAQVLPDTDTQITDLYLVSNGIGSAGADALAQVLPDTQITELDLRENEIGADARQRIRDVWVEMRGSVEGLRISYNHNAH